MRVLPILLSIILNATICAATGPPAPPIMPMPMPVPLEPLTAPAPLMLAPEGLGSNAAPVPTPTAASRAGSTQIVQSAFFDASDPEIRQAYKAWTIAYITRQEEVIKENKNVFAMSGSMSVLVCWVTHILLALAVLAAMVEFIRALQTHQQASQNEELRVSLEGIALKTSMHGTLLLLMAMGFYYLFLKFVYPVTIVPT